MIQRCLALVVIILGCVNLGLAQEVTPQIFLGDSGGIGQRKLIVLDARSLNVVAEVPLTKFPEVIAIRPDNRIALVAHFSRFGKNSGMSIVDLDTRRATEVFTNDEVPTVQLGPRGFFYALLSISQQLVVINPTSLMVERRVQLPARPDSIKFSPDGRLAYIDSTTSNQLFAIDLSSLNVVKSLNNLPANRDTGENSIAVSPDGRTLYLAADGSVLVIDADSLTIIDTLPGTANATALQITPDGETLFILDLGSINVVDSLIVVDTRTKRVRKKLNFALATNYMTLSPDGRVLYVNISTNALRIFDTASLEEILFLELPKSGGLGITISGNYNIGTPPQVNVLSPQPSEIIQRNNQFTIRWETISGGYKVVTHNVELSLNGGLSFASLGRIRTNPEKTEFQFTTPFQMVGQAQVRITSTDAAARSTTALSGIFSIGDRPTGDTEPPTVRFMSPIGGERFTAGDTVMVTWTSADNTGVASQDLSLSTDGGMTFPMVVAAGLGGAVQSFSFTIPNSLQTPNARLRLAVRDAAGNRAEATTPASFQIVAAADTQAPTVTIISPTMGQQFPAGQAITVNWRSVDNAGISSQALLLSLDGGASFQTVATFGAETASFTLNVPELERTVPRAQVKITATDGAGNVGESTAAFSLGPAIIMAGYSKPVLSINGVGFNSVNPQAQVRVLVNGREVAASVQSNTSITVRGNKKKLGLVRGANLVFVIIDGVQSNTSSFQF